MQTPQTQRDWLRYAPELDVPTDEEVRYEVNIISHGNAAGRPFGHVDDFDDRYED